MRLFELTLALLIVPCVLSHSAQALPTWESLGEEPSQIFALEPEGDDLTTVDFRTPEMREFPELGVTVPESGPGADDFFKSLALMTGRARAYTQKVLDAAHSPFTAPDGTVTTRLAFIQGELERAGLPTSLAWMVAQESGFNDRAHSRAGAWGAWQFIVKTADRFDLEIRTTTVSVRSRGRRLRTRTLQECTGCKNLDQATRAATEYLSEMVQGASLDKYYQWKGWKPGMPIVRWKGDWSLAMAAYNTGEHNVARAIYQSESLSSSAQPDFWSLRKLLHPQTRHYVPVILAWMRIGQDPKRFGF